MIQIVSDARRFGENSRRAQHNKHAVVVEYSAISNRTRCPYVVVWFHLLLPKASVLSAAGATVPLLVMSRKVRRV